MNQRTSYQLTAAAWQQVQLTLPLFNKRFQHVASGLQSDSPEIQQLDQEIFEILEIAAGTEHEPAAWCKICPSAQYARGVLKASRLSDGNYLLTRQHCH